MTLAEMQFVLPELRIASAEIFVLAMACLILIVDLFVKDKRRTLVYVLTQLTLVGAAAATMAVSTGGISYTFSNMFVSDSMGNTLKLMVYLSVFAVLLYSRTYVLDRPQMAKGEFYVLSLFATLGMMVMVSANHFLTVYIGIELLSLSLYAMVGMNRDSIPSTEASMKYFVLGALASGLLLYGMSMVYGATGTLEISTLSAGLLEGQGNGIILAFGLVFLVSGIAFKLGVVPFHMWIPDVYHGAPTAVTLFIASAPKLAAFAVVVRVLVNGLIVASQDWQIMLLVLSVLSMAVGNFAAVAQTLVVVVDGNGQHLLGILLPDHIVIEMSADLMRGWQLVTIALGRDLADLFADDVVAQLDALITYVDGRASDQLAHFMLAFAAKRAVEQLITLTLAFFCHSATSFYQ